VRRQYRDVLADLAAEGDLARVARIALRWATTALSPRAGRPLGGPALGTLLVTYRCNLRCRVCDLPARAAARRRAGDAELDTDAFRAVLSDMKAIGVLGVGVTGGEPMLRDDLVEILRDGAGKGLHVHLNTDGFRVAESARDLLRSGLRSVNVSLDGADAAEHDRARGRRGAFDDAVSALSALRRARGPRARPRLTAVTVLTAGNVGRAPAIARTALEAGADRVGVIPVHDFGQGEAAADPAAVREALSGLARLAEEGVLDNSGAYLDLLPRAFRGEESPLRCYAPYASVVVDCYGDVYPCFPLMERKRPVGRIPLLPLWRSEAYAAARRSLSTCRACLWNCHTEMNLALPQPRGALGARAEGAATPRPARAPAAAALASGGGSGRP
jgi:MoaA/NifB/PqqE/SkfB family radical SAM enzyme